MYIYYRIICHTQIININNCILKYCCITPRYSTFFFKNKINIVLKEIKFVFYLLRQSELKFIFCTLFFYFEHNIITNNNRKYNKYLYNTINVCGNNATFNFFDVSTIISIILQDFYLIHQQSRVFYSTHNNYLVKYKMVST